MFPCCIEWRIKEHMQSSEAGTLMLVCPNHNFLFFFVWELREFLLNSDAQIVMMKKPLVFMIPWKELSYTFSVHNIIVFFLHGSSIQSVKSSKLCSGLS